MENNKSEVILFDTDTAVFQAVKALYDYINYHPNTLTYEIDVLAKLHSIWSKVICSQKETGKVKKRIDIVRSERLKLAFSFIHTHYSESISVEDIANSCYVGKSEILRLFRRATNLSPYEYLIDFRIKQSVQLLDNTTLAVVEIATRVGYNSQSQFGKHFKERLGISPNAYRNINSI